MLRFESSPETLCEGCFFADQVVGMLDDAVVGLLGERVSTGVQMAFGAFLFAVVVVVAYRAARWLLKRVHGWRVARLIRRQTTDGEWWAARATRAQSRERKFYNACGTKRQYAVVNRENLEFLFPDERASPPPERSPASVALALRCDEISLRSAHYDNRGVLGDYTVTRPRCALCHHALPLFSCFLSTDYYCFGCVQAAILPRFVAPRLCLLRALGALPDDVSFGVARLVARLCFDADAITPSPRCRRCFVFQCDTAANMLGSHLLANRLARLLDLPPSFSVDAT